MSQSIVQSLPDDIGEITAEPLLCQNSADPKQQPFQRGTKLLKS